jgi:hypothetical protein
MPAAIAVERYRRVKIGEAKQKVVELSEQRSVGAHAQIILDRISSARC